VLAFVKEEPEMEEREELGAVEERVGSGGGCGGRGGGSIVLINVPCSCGDWECGVDMR